jgi:uncharacterized membrane protein
VELWEVLKLVHILAVVVALGANVTYLFWQRRAGSDRDRLVFVLETIGRLDRRVANPAYIVALLAGIGIVLTGPFSFETLWIAASIVLYVVVAVLGIAVYAPVARRQLAAASADPTSPEYTDLARRSMLLGLLTIGLVVVIVALMVLKPTL